MSSVSQAELSVNGLNQELNTLNSNLVQAEDERDRLRALFNEAHLRLIDGDDKGYDTAKIAYDRSAAKVAAIKDKINSKTQALDSILTRAQMDEQVRKKQEAVHQAELNVSRTKFELDSLLEEQSTLPDRISRATFHFNLALQELGKLKG